MNKPLMPPSVRDLILLLKMSGGRCDYRPERMAFQIAMPVPRLGRVWKMIEIEETELVNQFHQDYIKNFINECLAANGESNG